MARSSREVLLEEARERHKLELARYTEAHARVGFHLAVLGVFALALLRFIDKPPQPSGSCLFCLFSVSAVLLGLVTLVVFGLVLAVVWGYGTRFPAPMRTWLDQQEKLRASHAGADDADALVARDLEQHLLESLCEAADFNSANNIRRSRFIVYASRGLVAAATLFVVSGGAYLYLTFGRDATNAVSLTGPAEVRPQAATGGK